MRKTILRLFIIVELLIVIASLIQIEKQNNLLLHKPKEPFNFKLECENELKDYNEKLALIEQEHEKETRQKAFQLLNDYVNKYGKDCYKVAISFVKKLKSIDDYELVKIKESEVKCGDLIFYQNNGMGQTHWAVYLDEDLALQGKGTMSGINIIGKVHYDKFSKPIFYRVISKGE